MAGYCTLEDIQAEIQNTVFTVDTRPTISQVQTFCQKVTDQINVIVKSTSVLLPISDKTVLSYLQTVAILGVTARVYGIMAVASTKSSDQSKLFMAELKRIENNPMILNPTVGPRLDVVLNTFPDNSNPNTPRAFRRFEKQW